MSHWYYQQQRDRDRLNREKRAARIAAARQKGTHTAKEWELMIVFFGNQCVECEGESGLVNLEKDHIVPIYQGGSDSIRNLQPICAKCNRSKGPDRTDWRTNYCQKHGLELPLEWRGDNA